MHFLYSVLNASEVSLLEPTLSLRAPVCLECLKPETQDLFLSPVFHSLGVQLTFRKLCGLMVVATPGSHPQRLRSRGNEIISFPRCSSDNPEWMTQPGLVYVHVLGNNQEDTISQVIKAKLKITSHLPS